MSFFARTDVTDWVAVDCDMARTLRQTTEGREIVRIAEDITRKRVVGEGPKFEIADAAPPRRGGGGTNKRTKRAPQADSSGAISLDEMLEDVRLEWNRATEMIDADMVRQGFSLVMPVESQLKPGLLAPLVVDIEFYNVYQRYGAHGWQYAAVWRGLSLTQQEEFGVRDGDEITNATLLVGDVPRSDGALRSKLDAVAPLVQELSGLMESYAYGLFWMTHRWCSRSVGDASKGPPSAANAGAPPYANVAGFFNNQEVAKRVRDRASMRNARVETQVSKETVFQQAVAAGAVRLAEFQSAITHSDRVAQEGADANLRHAVVPPFAYEQVLPPGEKVDAGPEPHVAGNVIEYMNGLSRRIFLMLNVQPQLVSLEHANHAANSDIAFAMQNEAILIRQRMLEPHLAQAFRFVYAGALDLASVKLAESAALELPTKKAPAKGGGGGTQIAKHSAGAEVAVAPESIAHLVRARLTNVPMSTPDALLDAFLTGCVDFETYRELALQLHALNSRAGSTEQMTREEVAEMIGRRRAQHQPREPKQTSAKK